jgi:hypothetical protein
MRHALCRGASAVDVGGERAVPASCRRSHVFEVPPWVMMVNENVALGACQSKPEVGVFYK